MYCMVKEDNAWGLPQPLPFGGIGRCSYAVVSPLDHRIYLNVFKAGTGKMEIHSVERRVEGWGTPQPVAALNEPGSHSSFPAIALNGNLYFHSDRRGGMRAQDIYCSTIIAGRHSEPVNLGPQLNTAHNEFHPCVAPDERFIIFDSKGRGDAVGRQDLYISFRSGEGVWTPPRNLGKEINSETGDSRARLSPDGFYLFFSSNRENGGHDGIQNIYWVETGFIEDMRQESIL